MSKSATRLLIGQATTLLSTINLQFGTTSNLLGQYLLTIQKQQQEHMPTEINCKRKCGASFRSTTTAKKKKKTNAVFTGWCDPLSMRLPDVERCYLRWKEGSALVRKDPQCKSTAATKAKYKGKGGKKAHQKNAGTRRVVPELRPCGYRAIAAKVWKDVMGKILKDSYDRARFSRFQFYSRKITKSITCGNEKLIRVKKRQLDYAVERFIKFYVQRDFLHDDLKAPKGCPAVPASYAASAFNTYYSCPVKENEPKRDYIQGQNKEGYTLVWSYGSGSGASTIGLDTSTRKVFCATALHPAGRVLTLMEELARLDPTYNNQLGNSHLNVLSVKVYWGEKEVSQHCDIEMNKYSGPKANNSQQPGTPVLIYTVGDPKKLVFHRKELVPSTRHSRYDFAATQEDQDLTVGQFHKDLMVLDPRDESRRRGYYFTHSSNTKNLKAPCDSYYKGFSISVTGRVCVDQVWVSNKDNTVYSDEQPAQDQRVFQTAAAKSVMGSAQHKCVWAALKHNARTMCIDYLSNKEEWSWDSTGWDDKISKYYP